jgi:chromosome segregation ATPase
MDPQEPASKADLKKVETELRGDIKRVETALRSDIKNLERLIVDYMESMDREFKDVRASLARLETRFDTQAIRLDRQGALLQVGSRWTTRMNGWAERVDKALESKDHEISELKTRVEKLERGERPPGPSGPPASSAPP